MHKHFRGKSSCDGSEKRRGKMELKDIKMIDASEGGDISTWGEQQKDDFSFRILHLDDWKNKENAGVEMGEVQWNREIQTQISDRKYHFFKNL